MWIRVIGYVLLTGCFVVLLLGTVGAQCATCLTLPFAGNVISDLSAFSITNQGIGEAGAFTTNNAASKKPALLATSNGQGPGLVAGNYGQGPGAVFGIESVANPNPGLAIFTNGTGYAIKALDAGTHASCPQPEDPSCPPNYGAAIYGESRLSGKEGSSTEPPLNGGSGVLGKNMQVNGFGVRGVAEKGIGLQAVGRTGLEAIALDPNGLGVDGYARGGIGVRGLAESGGIGVRGTSETNVGVLGESSTGTGVQGSGIRGVLGRDSATDDLGKGVEGMSERGTGVYGYSVSGNGVIGRVLDYGTVGGFTPVGVYGQSFGFGVYGDCAIGEEGQHCAYAGFFNGRAYVAGDLEVGGNLIKSGGGFKIDHPRDPGNKYLSHSFVESPDMMNIYNGNVTLDSRGEAVVELPAWFEALNKEFRYQLTPIGASAPELYVAQEVSGGRFKIGGGKPSIKVSWQVTGIRNDPYAKEHRMVVEEEKPAKHRGLYLHPELYGQPKSNRINEALKPRPPAPTAPEQKKKNS